MLKKKIAAVLTAAVLAIPMAIPVQAVTYSDTQGHWAQAAIDYWSNQGVLVGYPDGTFKPDGLITRAEMAQVLTMYKGLTVQSTNVFKDISPTDWYYNAVLKCVQAGYIAGFEDGTFRGQQNLTREQAIAMVRRTTTLAPAASCSVTINDPNTISDWAKGEVYAMINAKIVPGFSNHAITKTPDYPTNTIAGTSLATRAFVVELLYYVVMNSQTVNPPLDQSTWPTPLRPGGSNSGGGYVVYTPTTPTPTPPPTGTPTPSPTPAASYDMYIRIRETTTSGGLSYNSDDQLVNLDPNTIMMQEVWNAVENFANTDLSGPDKGYNDAAAYQIMLQGINAYRGSAAQWADYVNTYWGTGNPSVKPPISDDFYAKLLNQNTTVAEFGSGAWILTFYVAGSGRTYEVDINIDPSDNPVVTHVLQKYMSVSISEIGAGGSILQTVPVSSDQPVQDTDEVIMTLTVSPDLNTTFGFGDNEAKQIMQRVALAYANSNPAVWQATLQDPQNGFDSTSAGVFWNNKDVTVGALGVGTYALTFTTPVGGRTYTVDFNITEE